MRIDTYFKIGDVVEVKRDPNYGPNSTNPRFASIVSIKVNREGIWYELSDDPIGLPRDAGCYKVGGEWVRQSNIVSRFEKCAELLEPQAAER